MTPAWSILVVWTDDPQRRIGMQHRRAAQLFRPRPRHVRQPED
jgi:hypothetical protein